MYLNLHIMIIIIIVISGLFNCINSKVIINIRFYDYSNIDDVLHNGNKCEYFHNVDHCDPKFTFYITNDSPFDILNKTVRSFTNTKQIYNVFTQTITRENIIFNKSLISTVIVDESDILKVDHIARFTSVISIDSLPYLLNKAMEVFPAGHNVELKFRIEIKCAEDYYGRFCVTRKYDKLQCQQICDNGQCILDALNITYYCRCFDGWMGIHCNELITTISNLETSTFSIKNKSDNYDDSSNLKLVENSSSHNTIILFVIVTLILIIIVCLIVFALNYRQSKKESNEEQENNQRPLPPICYQKNSEYIPKLSSDLKKYEKKLPMNDYENKNYDPYEEPIIDKMDSLTIDTEFDSEDTNEYEKPIDIKMNINIVV